MSPPRSGHSMAARVSPFVRKVAGLCIGKGVPYEVEAVNVFDPPQWFRDISPMKRIPCCAIVRWPKKAWRVLSPIHPRSVR